MVKIDLKDAYLTVPIWQNHQKYLRFLWRDSLLEFACLPFGLASAPRVFTKLLKPVLSILRQGGIRFIVYLDDSLLMAPSVEQVLQHAASTLNLLEGLGFTVNTEVGTSSFPTNGVPRVTRKLTRPKPRPPQGQNKKDPVEMPGSVKHPGYYCKGIVKIPGPPVLIHTGSLSSSPPLSVPPTSEKLCPQISQILRSCSPSRLGVPPRGTVVERQSSSMEW